jgi:hypothetical protein
MANESLQKLSSLVSAADVDRLVPTRRYWLLQSMIANTASIPLLTLLNAEVDERVRAFEDAQKILAEQDPTVDAAWGVRGARHQILRQVPEETWKRPSRTTTFSAVSTCVLRARPFSGAHPGRGPFGPPQAAQ